MRVHRDVGNADCDECCLQGPPTEMKPHGVLVQVGTGDEVALLCLPCLRRAVALGEAPPDTLPDPNKRHPATGPWTCRCGKTFNIFSDCEGCGEGRVRA